MASVGFLPFVSCATAYVSVKADPYMKSTAGFVSTNANFQNNDAVYVPRDEYNRLLQTSLRYGKLIARIPRLCKNLIRGGVNDETIELLGNTRPQYSEGETPSLPTASERPMAEYQADTFGTSYTARQPSVILTPMPSRHYGRNQWTDADGGSDYELQVRKFEPDANPEQHPQRRQFERVATRTLLLSNLAEGTSHMDITAVVRGGQLLDVYLRYRDKSATVSFLHAGDARAFYEHVRKHDLYIKHKRIEISWNDRQFTLTDHIARKIGLGATRNLVIRRCGGKFDENEIRNDLEHIHNLVVVRVEFISDDCHVSTNSVACASFARTCMMSRLKYKGSRVEFDADECVQSLARIAGHRRNPPTNPPTVMATSMPNRFELLNLGDE